MNSGAPIFSARGLLFLSSLLFLAFHTLLEWSLLRMSFKQVQPSEIRENFTYRTPVDKRRKEVDILVETYKGTVESYIQQQTMSWQRHYTRFEKDLRSREEISWVRRNLTLHAPQELLQLQEHVQHRSLGRRSRSENSSEPAKMIWDQEEDIPRYFDHLIQACSQDATRVVSFDIDCWDFLYSLVEKPFCTSRLDSTYECAGKEQRPSILPDNLIQEHFTDDTINIVIIGAGPAGLHLANILVDDMPSWVSHPIRLRVLVFENRIVKLGQKKPYTRNWITELNSDYFETIDPLLFRLLETLHKPGTVRIPIQYLETLLLLSSRYRGVKFLFDDFQRYREILTQTPNLVVFDATGHRLNRLERGDINGNPASVGNWSWFPITSQKHYFSEKVYHDLIATNSLVRIAEQNTSGGRILYPVSVNSEAYTAHLLKINDIRLSRDNWRQLKQVKAFSISDELDFCNAKNSHSPCHTQSSECQRWCGRAYAWDSTGYYREDIVARFKEHRRPRNLAFTVFLASISPRQADTLHFIMDVSSQKKVFHKDLPWTEMAQLPIFRHNGLRQLFNKMESLSQSGEAVVDLFAYQPYLYMDPEVPSGLFSENRTIVLRVGDSLASGDPNVSTGLGFHIRIMQAFGIRLKQALALHTCEVRDQLDLEKQRS